MKTSEFLTEKRVPVGIDNFRKLVDENYLFCDKTLIIKELIDRGNEVTLMVRPRRWGKTLNMSMLRHFFAPEVLGVPTKDLFNNLAIASIDAGRYMHSQGQFSVIFISFKDIHANTFESAYQKICEQMSFLYGEFEVLKDSHKLTEPQRITFSNILKRTATKSEVENSLKILSQCLYRYFGKKVYILIDEYDTPLNSAYDKYLVEITNFMRNLFSAALKGNEALERGVLTGILRVSKDSMLSGLNNLMTYTVLDEPYKNHFGFSEVEVTSLFAEKGAKLNLEDIRTWYNGYKIYDLVVYNPWSIMACLSHNGDIELYWTESARNDLVKSTIVDSTADIKSKLEILMQDGNISTRINKHVTFDSLKDNEIALWSLLLFMGYLKAESSVFDRDSGAHQCVLSIPNREVFMLYKQYTLDWFIEKLGGGEDKYVLFLDSLSKGNIPEFTENLVSYLLETASVFDVGGGKKGEAFYHGFSLALIAGLRNKYHIRSNREGGLGRYDVLLIPKNLHNPEAIILEFKHAKVSQKMATVAKEALEQINSKLYDTELKSYEYVKSILKVGTAFSGKSAISAYERTDLITKNSTTLLLTREII